MATAYEKVQLARGKGRPSGLSFIQNIFPDFIELHGDRRFADDPAVIGGIATLGGRAVTVIAIEKGAPGERAFNQAFSAWEASATQGQAQQGQATPPAQPQP